ncbi:MAG: hypothetical protein Fur0025_11640 [Oscillatoriaceae cyanobacterium]
MGATIIVNQVKAHGSGYGGAGVETDTEAKQTDGEDPHKAGNPDEAKAEAPFKDKGDRGKNKTSHSGDTHPLGC